jgi:hypothetical protein
MISLAKDINKTGRVVLVTVKGQGQGYQKWNKLYFEVQKPPKKILRERK